jgi:hypothetical protein
MTMAAKSGNLEIEVGYDLGTIINLLIEKSDI